MSAVLELSSVTRAFGSGPQCLEILTGIDLQLNAGEIVGLVGASGAGKSTLLHLIGLLDRPTGGHISLSGQDIATLSDGQRVKIRRNNVGFVYQFHHLLPDFTALENVAMPLRIQGQSARKAEESAKSCLADVGLAERLEHFPSELSGGEQQRVAIARALVGKPGLLLADEPTGNLDEATADKVFNLLLEQLRAAGSAALIATHDQKLAGRLDRILRLSGGKLLPA